MKSNNCIDCGKSFKHVKRYGTTNLCDKCFYKGTNKKIKNEIIYNEETIKEHFSKKKKADNEDGTTDQDKIKFKFSEVPKLKITFFIVIINFIIGVI